MTYVAPSIENRPLGQLDTNYAVNQSSYLDMAFLGDYTGTNLIYKGFARPGASTAESVWQIAFLTYDGSNNILSITWPLDSHGAPSNDYKFIWDNRASYTYA